MEGESVLEEGFVDFPRTAVAGSLEKSHRFLVRRAQLLDDLMTCPRRRTGSIRGVHRPWQQEESQGQGQGDQKEGPGRMSHVSPG